MTSPKDIENMMRDAALEEAARTRERYAGTADQVYERLKLGLPDRLRTIEKNLYRARIEGIELDDELRLAVVSVGVKRGSLAVRAKVSDAGTVGGSPAADVDIESVQLQESKLFKPDQVAIGSSLMAVKGAVWGEYLNG